MFNNKNYLCGGTNLRIFIRNNNMTKIYLISNIDGDLNKVYIGKTKNSREADHRHHFGKQIIYEEIDQISSSDINDWKPLETKWIQYYIDLGYKVLNKNKGGGGPTQHTLSAKQKIGDRVSAKLKGRISPMKGKKHTEKTKQQQSISAIGKHKGGGFKGKTHKPESIMKMNKHICQIEPTTGVIIAEFTSVDMALRQLNIKGISNVLSGRAKTSGGFKWNYKQ
jgi:hypothetical protein